jgi:uncharacterized protein with HEPN domain
MKATKQYLQDILKAITRIESYTHEGKDSFFQDTKTQDAVTRNFEIIGEVVKRIPKDVLNQRPEVPWQDIAGFRDVLIHDYAEIDSGEVWLTIERDLPALHIAVDTLLANLSIESESDDKHEA